MSAPVPAPRLLCGETTKKPVPTPRKRIMLSRQKSNESNSSKSSDEHTKTFSRRVRSISNASKQIAEDIGGIVHDQKKAIIEGTRQSVRRITKRFSATQSEHNTEATGVKEEDIAETLDLFNNIRFDSPITTLSEPIYNNINQEESSASSVESFNLPPPLHPPPPLPGESLYDAPVSLSSNSTSQDTENSGQSTNFNAPKSEIYECVFPSEPYNSDSESCIDMTAGTLDKNVDLSRSTSWNFYDPVVRNEATGKIDTTPPLKPESVISDSTSALVDQNSNFSLEVRNSIYENHVIDLKPACRPSKSVIYQFDPLVENAHEDNAEQAVTKSQEYRLLEELLQGDLYGNVSTQNTLDNWSISDYDSEEFENPPPPPPLRFDSLPEEETKSTPTTPQLKRHSRTQWFTDHQPSTASTAKSSSSDIKKGWFQQVKNVVLASSELVKGGVRHRDSMVDRPRTGNGKYSNKKGMLYKVQKGPVEELFGEYSGRWCVLENLSLQCYADNTCETMKEQFPTDSILSIQILQDTKIKHDNADLHCFQLNTSGKIRGRHVYGSRNMAERRDWMQKLAECLTKSFSSKFTSDYLRMGWAYVREAVTGNWAGAWIILSNRILQYAIDDQPLKTIDLRRARFIDLQDPQESDNNPRTSDEKGPNMFVDWTSGVLYLRMWTARETKAWCYVVKKAAHNNGPNLEDQQLTKNDIPVIVEKCINFIYLHGSMSKGIYRQSGVGSSISDLITKFREDAWAMQITQDKYTEHDVATALKRFFRDLPEPLLGPAHHQYLYQVSLVKNVEDRIRMYKAALDNLSPIAYKTTRKLIGHLHFISTQSGKNLMTVQNLAALWGPTLMHYENKDGPQQSGGHKQHILIVSQLINLYRNIFPEDRDEIEKEQLMLQILEKHTQSPQGAINKTAGDFRVWIYFNNKEGKTFNIAIGPNKTALDILVELSPKVNIDVHELTLEEVVLDDKLFRPIHYQEKVLDIVLRWSYWDEADRKENYIAISQLAKYAEYQETKPATFAEEIKYADPKSRTFKPLVFEFSQAKLTCFKDKLCTVPLSSWKVEEIFWYFGHEAKRNPQRKWTVTFFDKDVHPKRTKTSPYFGHILAWDDPQSRMNWLGAMLRAQYPNGLQPPVIHINLIT